MTAKTREWRGVYMGGMLMWIINEIKIWLNNRRAIKKLLSGEWVLEKQ